MHLFGEVIDYLGHRASPGKISKNNLFSTLHHYWPIYRPMTEQGTRLGFWHWQNIFAVQSLANCQSMIIYKGCFCMCSILMSQLHLDPINRIQIWWEGLSESCNKRGTLQQRAISDGDITHGLWAPLLDLLCVLMKLHWVIIYQLGAEAPGIVRFELLPLLKFSLWV